ncbi:hypothetical protein [Streptomyces carminius]|nr:hypothetical protein [Streptomyces carminius]
MPESVFLIIGLTVAPVLALALLIWGLNGTSWLLRRLTGQSRRNA